MHIYLHISKACVTYIYIISYAYTCFEESRSKQMRRRMIDAIIICVSLLLHIFFSLNIFYSRRAFSSAIRTETMLSNRASYAARAACISLTCSAVDTHVRRCYIRIFACATATCISTASSAALWPLHTAGMH
jgi:hypothetical protein